MAKFTTLVSKGRELHRRVALLSEFDSGKHPRQPAGSGKGGEFAPKSGGGIGQITPAMRKRAQGATYRGGGPLRSSGIRGKRESTAQIDARLRAEALASKGMSVTPENLRLGEKIMIEGKSGKVLSGAGWAGGNIEVQFPGMDKIQSIRYDAVVRKGDHLEALGKIKWR